MQMKPRKLGMKVYFSIVPTSKGGFKAKIEMESERDGKPVLQEFYSDSNTSPRDFVKKMDTSLLGAFFAVCWRDNEDSMIPDEARPKVDPVIKAAPVVEQEPM